MPIILKDLSVRELREIPPKGTYNAICAEVVEDEVEKFIGVTGGTSVRRRGRIIFELDKCSSDGIPLIAQGCYNFSLHPDSALRKVIETWLGRLITEEESIEGFDLEKMIGKKATVRVSVRESSQGNIYEVIDGVIPPTPENPLDKVSPHYKRPKAPYKTGHKYGNKKKV